MNSQVVNPSQQQRTSLGALSGEVTLFTTFKAATAAATTTSSSATTWKQQNRKIQLSPTLFTSKLNKRAHAFLI